MSMASCLSVDRLRQIAALTLLGSSQLHLALRGEAGHTRMSQPERQERAGIVRTAPAAAAALDEPRMLHSATHLLSGDFSLCQ